MTSYSGRDKSGQGRRSSIVLDDDPTGTQAVAGVPVVLDWSDEALREALSAGSPRAIHVLTNSRALSAERARETTFDAACAALEALPNARLVLRGDSTLFDFLRGRSPVVADAGTYL